MVPIISCRARQSLDQKTVEIIVQGTFVPVKSSFAFDPPRGIFRNFNFGLFRKPRYKMATGFRLWCFILDFTPLERRRLPSAVMAEIADGSVMFPSAGREAPALTGFTIRCNSSTTLWPRLSCNGVKLIQLCAGFFSSVAGLRQNVVFFLKCFYSFFGTGTKVSAHGAVVE